MHILRLRDNRPLSDLPVLQNALHIRLEPGRERLLDLILVTKLVTLCHRGLVEVREQRSEPLDIVVWLLQQLGHGDGVVKAERQTQQHWAIIIPLESDPRVLVASLALGFDGYGGVVCLEMMNWMYWKLYVVSRCSLIGIECRKDDSNAPVSYAVDDLISVTNRLMFVDDCTISVVECYCCRD